MYELFPYGHSKYQSPSVDKTAIYLVGMGYADWGIEPKNSKKYIS